MPSRRLYIDPDYADGFDGHMKEHPLCRKCDEIEVEKEGDMCVGCVAQKGGGDPEMKAMESRDLNEDEGDK